MSARLKIDRGSFQAILADAFVVQESGLDKQSLSAFVEVQHLITSDGFDMHRAMNMIAECTLDAFHASGVAIALLEADKLVYLAGSGSASEDVGRQVPAVLIASSRQKTRREILRVENATSDTRIEAAICRQFGAISLLMLPVFKNNVLAGVLQVHFKDAHFFLGREVRTYQLMVGALEDAMLRDVRSAQREPERSIRQVLDDQITSRHLQSSEETAKTWVNVAKSGQRTVSNAQPIRGGCRGASVSLTGACRIYQAALIREVAGRCRELSSVIRKTGYWPRSGNVRIYEAAISAAIVLSGAIWVLYPHHRPEAQKSHLSAWTQRGVLQQTPAFPLLSNQQPSHVSHHATARGRGFKRLRIGPNEVDYIAEDVRIRQFESEPVKPRMLRSVKEVKFGDDVIVRYFAAPSPHLSQTLSPADTR